MSTIGYQVDYGLIKPIETQLDRQAKIAQIRQVNQATRLAEKQDYQQDQDKKTLADLVSRSYNPETGEIDKQTLINNAYQSSPNLGLKLDQAWSEDLLKQKRKKLINDAYSSAVKGDGTYDENKLFSNLMKVDPEVANNAISTLRSNFSALLKNDLERKSLLVPSLEGVKDHSAYESIKAVARTAGIGTSDLPDEYNPDAINQYIQKYKDPAAKHKEFEDAMAKKKQDAEGKRLQLEGDKLNEEIRNNKANNKTTWYNAETGRMNALNNKDQDKNSLFGGLSGTYANSNDVKGTLINGLSLIPNTLISKESVNKTKQAYDTYLNLQKQIESLKEQYKANGTELVGNKAEVMKATTRGVQLTLKELENLGVLNGPDLSLMEQMVPNPTGVSGTARGMLNPLLGDKVIPMLDNLQKRIDTKLDANLQVNGFKREGSKNIATDNFDSFWNEVNK